MKKNADNCDVLHCIGMALVLVDSDSKNTVLDIGMVSGISIFDEGNGHHGIQGNGPKSGAIKVANSAVFTKIGRYLEQKSSKFRNYLSCVFVLV